MSVQDDRYAVPSFDNRVAPRKRLAIPAILQPANGKRISTMLRDLSLSGFSASAMNRIPAGTACSLTLPDREAMPARVVWWDGGLVGCAFDKSMGGVTYDAILERWDAETNRRR